MSRLRKGWRRDRKTTWYKAWWEVKYRHAKSGARIYKMKDKVSGNISYWLYWTDKEDRDWRVQTFLFGDALNVFDKHGEWDGKE